MNKRLLSVILLALAAGLLALAGFAAAQDDPDESPQPFLGIQYEAHEDGVLVTRVLPASPAREAGLRRGDVITAIDGAAVTADSLVETLSGYAVGDTVTLEVRRGDESLQIEVTLGERSVQFRGRGPRAGVIVGNPVLLGVLLEDGDGGVTIAQVIPGSPAAEAGVLSGDVITGVNGTEVSNVREVVELVRSLRSGDTVTLTLARNGETLTVEVTLAEPANNVTISILGGDTIVYLEEEQAWEIRELDEDSMLAQAGLLAGDRITAINGESYGPGDLPLLARVISPGETVTLTVERDGETLEIELSGLAVLSLVSSVQVRMGPGGPGVLEVFPGPFPLEGMAFGFAGVGRVYLGVTFATLNEEVAAEHNVTVTEGALIVEVAPDSPAAEAGLQPGDIVVAVEGDIVDEWRTLAERLFAYEPGEIVTLQIIRDGETLEIEVTLGEPEFPFNFGFGPRTDRPGRPGQEFRFQFPAPQQPEPTPVPDA